MRRPNGIFEWATDGDNIEEPSSGRKAEGWLPATRPPAQFFNWILNLVGQWIVWLSARSESLDAAHAAHAFDLNDALVAGHTSSCVAANDDGSLVVSVGRGTVDGDGGHLAWSDDYGRTFTNAGEDPSAIGDARLTHVHFGGGKFVAAGSVWTTSPSNQIRVLVTDDGINTTHAEIDVDFDTAYVVDGCYDSWNGVHYLAISGGGSSNNVLKSEDDGVTWSSSMTSTGNPSGLAVDTFGRAVVVGAFSGSKASYSTSDLGASWVAQDSGPATLQVVVYDDSRSAFIAADFEGKVFEAPSGDVLLLEWTQIGEIDPFAGSFDAATMTLHGGMLVAADLKNADADAFASRRFAYSLDGGRNWVAAKTFAATIDASHGRFAKLSFAGHPYAKRLYFGTGDGERVVRSGFV